MNKNFNLFRLNCMMDDNKSKNYNSILVSLISELLYENYNSEITREECYHYLVNDLKIRLQKDIFIKIIEKSSNFIHTPNQNDVGIRLNDKKFAEINDNVEKHSIDKHIGDFIKEEKLPTNLRISIESLLYHAIYENINSFTIHNIDSIIPINAKEKFRLDEIDAFNSFLSYQNKEKNNVIFSIFLKAVEFAIITSGKGVNEFTKSVFEGKEYLLDANIIFRLLGIGGKERQLTLINLIDQCNHQGIKFFYTNESYQEFKRKVSAITLEIKRSTENRSVILLEEIINYDKIELNEGFITHYAQCKSKNEVRTPDQYETKIMADFRTLCINQKISPMLTNNNLKAKHVDNLQNLLFKEKKKLNNKSSYTKTAAKVDAFNVLSVKLLRKQNDYNYSDVKSFYLSTDRTLNRILANQAGDKIAETILPSQLFILHNSLSDNENEDYAAFTQFLKRRTTEFKYTGTQVLTFIDEIRNYTNEPENIKEILKAYSDKKYETSLLEIDVEPEYLSIKDFTEAFLDQKLKNAELGHEKYKNALENAFADLPKFLQSTTTTIKIIDVGITIIVFPVIIFILKKFIEDNTIAILLSIILAAIQFILSSRLNLLTQLAEIIFMNKVRKSSFNKTFKNDDLTYIKEAKDFIKTGIKIWIK